MKRKLWPVFVLSVLFGSVLLEALAQQDNPQKIPGSLIGVHILSHDGEANVAFEATPAPVFTARVTTGKLMDLPASTIVCQLFPASGTYTLKCPGGVELIVTDWFLSVYTGDPPPEQRAVKPVRQEVF